MAKMFPVVIVAVAVLLWSCSKRNGPVDPVSQDETGTLKMSVNLGRTGVLRKTVKNRAIDMSNLIIVLSADGQNTIRDTLPLTGGYNERTERQTYAGLVAWINGEFLEWTLHVESQDQNDQVIHSGDTVFTLQPGDTIEISLSLAAGYSMLVANYFPIQDSVTRCVLGIDGDSQADSSFPKQTLVGDTVTLSYDYLTASPAGVEHHIDLDVYGEVRGIEALLYSGDTTIIVRSGEDERYEVMLSYIGPPDMLDGAATMTVTLGRVGTVNVNGIMASDDTLYVDSAAQGDNTGESWENAFPGLQEALARANYGTVILMAKGTYYPDSIDWSRIAPFELKSGLSIYGGYPTGGGQRGNAYQTILSGDIPADPDHSCTPFWNVYVVTAENVDGCTMDGLTVTGGHGGEFEEPGGGMLIVQSSPLIRNCIFRNNSDTVNPDYPDPRDVYGGGIRIFQGSPIIENCVFSNNYLRIRNSMWADHGSCFGGAIASTGGSPTITGCTFLNNSCSSGSLSGDCNGGAVYLTGGSPTITGCTFSGNRCTNNCHTGNSHGGALCVTNGTVSGCTFLNNHCNAASISGQTFGGAIQLGKGTIDGCSFSGNSSEANIATGGALYMPQGILTNCTFSGNFSLGDIAAAGGAIIMLDGSLINCTFTGNSSSCMTDSRGGAVNLSQGTLINCILWGNAASSDPEISGSATTIRNCVIQGGYSGGGSVDSVFVDDPLLGPFGDNGGPVFTIPIDVAGSAHDNGTSNVPSGVDISIDARGFPRSDEKPDIGAFEIQ